MASLICAISSEVPESPVVSPVSGQVYERRLIEKYIDENGTDPISKEPLSKEQLVEIKVSPLVKPKPPSATSIPAILKSLQDEWDAVMLHSFTLRQQLQTARQELSHALYQHDAACRVIARLNKEVTAAREALATLKPQAGGATPLHTPAHAPATPVHAETPVHVQKPVEESGMTGEILEKLQEKATVLTQERKRRGRTVPQELMSAESISSFVTQSSHPGLHSASVPGILALDIFAKDTSKILTGGADKNATVFNKDLEQVVAVLKGHTKKVNHVVYHPTEDTAITGSHDATVRVWNVPTAQTMHLLKVHEGPITGLSLHATGDYILTTSTDQCWAFSDIRSGRLVSRVNDQSGGVALTCAQFHPDGLLVGTGTADANIKIWDLKEGTNVANFPGHTGQISALAFSENGYYLATAADDSCVKLWDLRKLKNFKTLQLDEGYEVRDINFDTSGTYLAVAGTDVRVYLCKQWTELLVMQDHTATATGVRFGDNSRFIASTSMDRTLKIYGPA
ncbi:pre-mRNA-processing factor 19-like [Eurytemora carolleeae]|uniref:pre-mRNA-processing factor 19-like n=1 Tax=Eurytemora carolleeae TaxID=1294199 RepID=UPI000C775D32|nr:pre-mRNA-processing factor 19-like [Eurytemora carolleeae]|eukprot:XP_023322006.1 pre-mRNA-processing factor 19-like [Eurytemora affinis]